MRALEQFEITAAGLNPDDFDRVFAYYDDTCPIFRYLKGNRSGFIYNGKVTTEAIYTPAWKVIRERFVVTAPYIDTPFHNNKVLLDAQTGETLVTGFGAYFVKKNLLAYRVNGKTCEDHRWGIYDLDAHKNVSKVTWKYPAIYEAIDRIITIRETVKKA